jgi:hypothetical protein
VKPSIAFSFMTALSGVVNTAFQSYGPRAQSEQDA